MLRLEIWDVPVSFSLPCIFVALSLSQIWQFDTLVDLCWIFETTLLCWICHWKSFSSWHRPIRQFMISDSRKITSKCLMMSMGWLQQTYLRTKFKKMVKWFLQVHSLLVFDRIVQFHLRSNFIGMQSSAYLIWRIQALFVRGERSLSKKIQNTKVITETRHKIFKCPLTLEGWTRFKIIESEHASKLYKKSTDRHRKASGKSSIGAKYLDRPLWIRFLGGWETSAISISFCPRGISDLPRFKFTLLLDLALSIARVGSRPSLSNDS